MKKASVILDRGARRRSTARRPGPSDRALREQRCCRRSATQHMLRLGSSGLQVQGALRVPASFLDGCSVPWGCTPPFVQSRHSALNAPVHVRHRHLLVSRVPRKKGPDSLFALRGSLVAPMSHRMLLSVEVASPFDDPPPMSTDSSPPRDTPCRFSRALPPPSPTPRHWANSRQHSALV